MFINRIIWNGLENDLVTSKEGGAMLLCPVSKTPVNSGCFIAYSADANYSDVCVCEGGGGV
jgi:hypothetical protein